MYTYENMHWSQKGIFRSGEFHEIPPPISIRPQSELVRTHVVTVSCLPLQDDAYHRFLNRFFSSVTLTPCLSSSGLGQLATADHEGASPLTNNEKNRKNLRFLHHICQCEGLSGLFGGRFFLWVCMDMYAYENIHWSQTCEFRSAEFHEIPPPISIRPQSELVRTHVVTVSSLPLQDDAYHRFLNCFFSSVTLTPCLSSSGLGQLATADHEGASSLANNEKK